MRLEWLLRYLLPYEADQGPDEFAEHTGSVAVDVEIRAHRYGTEVQSEAAVVPTGDGNVLTDEYMRVALAVGGCCRLGDVDVAVAHTLYEARSLESGHLHMLGSFEIEDIASVVCSAEGHHAIDGGCSFWVDLNFDLHNK